MVHVGFHKLYMRSGLSRSWLSARFCMQAAGTHVRFIYKEQTQYQYSSRIKYRVKSPSDHWPIQPELIPVSGAWSDKECFFSAGMGCYSIAGLSLHWIYYPIKHLGGKRHCESKVSCPRAQRSIPGQVLKVQIQLSSVNCTVSIVCYSVKGAVALWSVHSNLDWAVWAQVLAGDIGPIPPRCWEQACNQWTSIPSWGAGGGGGGGGGGGREVGPE